MKLKSLSPAEFDRVSAYVLSATKMEDGSMRIVRAVLVDQLAPGTAAEQLGVTKQRVSNALATFRRAYERMVTPSMGFVGVDMELPERLAFELDSLMTKLRTAEDSDLRSKAIGLVLAGVEKARALLRSSNP
ncbi:hypothetical protein DBR42_01065 [Pelomonas sp. HMWF004]|nr:hypothetical protein DBR42_01065 [Pelomonas sp. HMWF004]